MSNQNAVVGIYKTHTEAEAAVKELQKSGFDMKKLSVVGKDYHTEENVVGFYNAGDRMKFWGRLGAFWGGLWGMLFGSAFFVIPGLGQLVVLGPLVMMIVGALEGAAVTGGLSAPQNHESPVAAELGTDLVPPGGVATESLPASRCRGSTGAGRRRRRCTGCDSSENARLVIPRS